MVKPVQISTIFEFKLDFEMVCEGSGIKKFHLALQKFTVELLQN
jgi:hypothetical protein